VFIDGDHSAAAVAHDSALAFAICQAGGVVIWHDYHTGLNVEVKPVLDRLAAEGRPITLVQGTWIAFSWT